MISRKPTQVVNQTSFDLNVFESLCPNRDKAFLDGMESSFNQEGMMRIEGVFSKDLIQRLHNAYFDVYAVGDKGKAQSVRFDVGYGDRFLYPVVFRHPFDHPSLYDSSLLFPLLRRILGEQLIIQSFGIVS